jgi:hypothetical protein
MFCLVVGASVATDAVHFSCAGVECYAGKIGGNIPELDPTTYVSWHYTEINFNSMVRGIVLSIIFAVFSCCLSSSDVVSDA